MGKIFSFAILFTTPHLALSWQLNSGRSEPSTVNAVRITEAPVIDGRLNDEAWKHALLVSNFTQRELAVGEPATERTQVGIVYDDRALYIAIWCYDSSSDRITANEFRRDFDRDVEDNIGIIFDTYRDKRNGFLFVVNPNGARFDALVTDEGSGVNVDWNGIWDAKTVITDEGWFAEIEIPFSTLRFSDDTDQLWGVNFERNIRRKREQVLWQGFLRNYSLTKLSQAGTLTGLHNIKRGEDIQVKPYVLAGGEKGFAPFSDQRTKQTKAGIDLKYAVTPTLTLDITTNTDFAQVEADRAQINLTRFPLFFAEKREFFLEGAGIFSFQFGDSPRPFYSRRIGLSETRELIPILAGARLVGKAGSYNLGVLTMQTGEASGDPTTNYSVVRVKRDVLEQSYVGIIATNKQSQLSYNRLLGFDGAWIRSDVFGTNTLIVGAALASTVDPGVSSGNLAYRFYVDFPNDFVDHFIGIRSVQKNFDPQVGFRNRADFIQYSWTFRIRPRPEGIGMQYLEFKPAELDYFVDPGGALQSLEYEGRIFGFRTNSGESFEFNFQRYADRLDGDFQVFEGIIIPQSTYWWSRWELQLETNDSRDLSSFFLYRWGGFYDGDRKTYIVNPQAKFSKHFSMGFEYTRNTFELRGGAFATDEIGCKATYGFFTTLNTSVLTQWNNEDKQVNLNFRVHWIPKIGSDMYLVYNQLFDANGTIQPSYATVIAKVSYLFTL